MIQRIFNKYFTIQKTENNMNLTQYTILMTKCVLNIHKPQILWLFNRNISLGTRINIKKRVPKFSNLSVTSY